MGVAVILVLIVMFKLPFSDDNISIHFGLIILKSDLVKFIIEHN